VIEAENHDPFALTNANAHRRFSEKDQPVTSKTAPQMITAALLADRNTAKSTLTKSERHHQLMDGVGAPENGNVAQVRRTAVSKPTVAYSIPEAARAAAIGVTKLRLEIRAGRLRARKVGKRSIVTANDLENWAAALPDIHDVAPDTVAKRVVRAEVTET
jgi:hypothetical protein